MIHTDSGSDFTRISVEVLMALLTVRTAADALGVSYSTLKQWIFKGTLRTVRTGGGHHRVPQAEVDRLSAAQTTVSRTSTARPARARRTAGAALVAISGRNQLRGVIEEVRVDGLLAQIRMRIGDQTLTAVITRDAVDALKLKRGQTALAVIKATEVMVAKEME
jgi:molybdopterin-binding protein